MSSAEPGSCHRSPLHCLPAHARRGVWLRETADGCEQRSPRQGRGRTRAGGRGLSRAHSEPGSHSQPAVKPGQRPAARHPGHSLSCSPWPFPGPGFKWIFSWYHWCYLEGLIAAHCVIFDESLKFLRLSFFILKWDHFIPPVDGC